MNRMQTQSTEREAAAAGAVYVSPRELMARWRCSRSQVDRIARREQFTRLLLGRGRNGMVRYVWAEVLEMEACAKA